MTPPPYSEESDVDARYRALLFLHAQSPAFRDIDLSGLPGYEELSIDAALQVVAAAPLDQISVSARLAVLYDLNRAGAPDRGTPRHRLSRGRRLRARGEDRPAAGTRPGLAARRPGGIGVGRRALRHDVQCRDRSTITRPRSSGSTSARSAASGSAGSTRPGSTPSSRPTPRSRDVADWVDPRNWHTWGPLFFRRMDLLMSPPAPVDISPPPPGDQHWHGVFHEEVALVQVLNTLLRCSYWRDPAAAAMTYDLKDSVDDEIDVDRGFLLVTDVDGVRRVQVLKIVSFTTDWWDLVARLVCPFWTDWVRFAVRGGTKSVPAATDPVRAGDRFAAGRVRRCLGGVRRRVREAVPRPRRGRRVPGQGRGVRDAGPAARRHARLGSARQGLGPGLDHVDARRSTGRRARSGRRPARRRGRRRRPGRTPSPRCSAVRRRSGTARWCRWPG